MEQSITFLLTIFVVIVLPIVSDKISYFFWQLIKVINKKHYSKYMEV
jgi:hypothetical protein